MTELVVDHWWIDIGMEIQGNQQVMWWCSDAPWQILQRVLELDNETVEHYTKTSTFYHDLTAQLTDVGNFRYEPSQSVQQRTKVFYIQAYNMEKSPMYFLNGGNTHSK
ncbi:hypothetical protein SCP_0202260 [Sparassis crispa]|uniref:Uncharacterized protein n=1 Tax=Sparassis crispa TaxID=139825 RepID=A0A401GA54_9APHY|nr:hypothetical protein SCP_0202260 [Sparassis crispa]GBE79029.1 hypothetical protein SCP_0202260 [Sparassis crispa]